MSLREGHGGAKVWLQALLVDFKLAVSSNIQKRNWRFEALEHLHLFAKKLPYHATSETFCDQVPQDSQPHLGMEDADCGIIRASCQQWKLSWMKPQVVTRATLKVTAEELHAYQPAECSTCFSISSYVRIFNMQSSIKKMHANIKPFPHIITFWQHCSHIAKGPQDTFPCKTCIHLWSSPSK